MGKMFSLNHRAIGTTRSGSFTPPEDWDHSDPDPSTYAVERAGMTLEQWRETAEVGAEYDLGGGVYLARVE